MSSIGREVSGLARESIGVGIIGTGFGGKIHVPGFQSVPGARIIGIAGVDPHRTEIIAREMGIGKTYRSWEALLDDENIHAVSIATPPYVQHQIVLDAVKRGKHVLCEKPFGISSRQAHEMWTAASNAGVVHMVDFIFRMSPELNRLKELLGAGSIGRILHVNIEWTLPGRVTRDSRWCWQVDPSAGGGSLFAFGSHVVDYVEWLFGPVQAVSANLSVNMPIVWEESSEKVSAEDTFTVMMKLQKEPLVLVSVSTATPGGRGHWISVYGEKGTLVVGNSNLHDLVIGTHIYRIGLDGQQTHERQASTIQSAETTCEDGRLVLFSRMAAAFINAVRSGQSHHPTFADGWRAHVLMEAIRRSHESRQWVQMADPRGLERVS